MDVCQRCLPSKIAQVKTPENYMKILIQDAYNPTAHVLNIAEIPLAWY